MSRLEQQKKGGGFVTYSWAVLGRKEAAPKISYQDYDEDWDWIISARAYEIDFNSGAEHIRISSFRYSLVLHSLGQSSSYPEASQSLWEES